jgi:hypothetical protein
MSNASTSLFAWKSGIGAFVGFWARTHDGGLEKHPRINANQNANDEKIYSRKFARFTDWALLKKSWPRLSVPFHRRRVKALS